MSSTVMDTIEFNVDFNDDDYIPYRNDRSYDYHKQYKLGKSTVRKRKSSSWQKKESTIVEIESNRTVIQSGDKISIPVTQVDEVLNYNFSEMRGSFYYGKDATLLSCESLNCDGRWENVIDCLDKYSVAKSTDHNYFENYTETTYSLPITGHIINTDADIKHFGFLNWCGKYYDPKYLYRLNITSDNIKLNQVGTVKHDDCKFSDPNIKQLDSKFSPNVHGSNNQGYWYPTNSASVLDIDLGKNTYITHIGTIGYQTKLRFPPQDYEKRSINDHPLVKLYNKNKNKHFNVQVVDPEGFSGWITTYKLYYRVDKHKWQYVGMFDGNTDSISMKMNDLINSYNSKDGLFARYLRLMPVEWHNSPAMKVTIYGISNESSHIDNEQVVKYTVITHHASKYVAQRKSSYNEHDMSPRRARSKFMNHIKNEQDY